MTAAGSSFTRNPPSSAFLGAALLPAILTAWVLWVAPIPDLTADRTAIAARDFTALWGAGQLALLNDTAALADPALFTQSLRDWFGQGMPNQIWPYPPPTLMLAAPLAHLPLGWSFLFYTVATLLLLWSMLRLAGLERPLCASVLLSPAIADNILIGQNGALTAALLVGGLSLLQRRPLLAGALLGMLILKPQLALLVPICLVAGAHWRAAMTALAVGAAIVGLSWACFGPQAWTDYATIARPAIQAYFEAPWDSASAQHIFASAFMAGRSLGATLTVAYAIQCLVTAACAVVTFLAWRRPGAEPRLRVALTLALACLASPWIHSYDMTALAVAIVTLSRTDRALSRFALALAWCWPALLMLVAIPVSLLFCSTAAVAALAWHADRRGHLDTSWRPLACDTPVSF